MAEKITVQRKIYGKQTFTNTVDTGFNQLVPTQSSVQETQPATVESFFDTYDELFYSIPPSGSNSHQTIVSRSSDYMGISYDDLISEINELRNENVSLKNQLYTLTNS